MKNNYEKIDLEIYLFQTQDVIATSNIAPIPGEDETDIMACVQRSAMSARPLP